MRNKTKQNYFLYYKTNTDHKFLLSVRNCKYPERTKEYKRLLNWLGQSLVNSVGYCDQSYFDTYKPNFIYWNGSLYFNQLTK
jgi:hypothetical protein